MKTILRWLGIYSPYRNPADVSGWTACWSLPFVGWIVFTHQDGARFWNDESRVANAIRKHLQRGLSG